MRIVSRQPSEAQRPKMGALSCLPVFFTLTDKPVLVAGGSDAAAWKAELLAAAGARVHVFAPVGEREDELLAQEKANIVTLHDCLWRDARWSGMALAVGDLADEEAIAFVGRAKAESVPVNVIDKPAFCQFQFGSIVNRSPLVVGISTTGAAPILGQAVRRRIETLLPEALSEWAKIADAIRSRVTEALGPGAQRRAFWERLADLAFKAQPQGLTPDCWIAEAKQAPTGRVTLVGAGPGDADHLTIKAVRALQAADVILFDDLVSNEVLELARREAKRILVGKRARRESCRQDDINALMLDFARQGRNVVRLKSGDPMVFGRAGEEIEALEKAGIQVDVVPGVSAVFALAAELKISLTHRNFAQSLRLTTGHAKNGQLPNSLDWQGLADPHTTNVFYMAKATTSEIAANLIRNGADPATPIVLAHNVGGKDQMIVSGPLRDAPDLVSRIKGAGPVLAVMGQVFARHCRAADEDRHKTDDRSPSLRIA